MAYNNGDIMKLPDDIFVLVLEKDVPEELCIEISGPIVLETPIEMASKKSAIALYRKWDKLDHGQIKIGRVIFCDTDQAMKELCQLDIDRADDLIDSVSPLFQYVDIELLDDETRASLRDKINEWIADL